MSLLYTNPNRGCFQIQDRLNLSMPLHTQSYLPLSPPSEQSMSADQFVLPSRFETHRFRTLRYNFYTDQSTSAVPSDDSLSSPHSHKHRCVLGLSFDSNTAYQYR